MDLYARVDARNKFWDETDAMASDEKKVFIMQARYAIIDHPVVVLWDMNQNYVKAHPGHLKRQPPVDDQDDLKFTIQSLQRSYNNFLVANGLKKTLTFVKVCLLARTTISNPMLNALLFCIRSITLSLSIETGLIASPGRRLL